MYTKLCEIYENTHTAIFSCALTYTIDKGLEYVKEISDDEIEAVNGNGLMTKQFCQSLIKTARDIALNADSGVELIQFANAKDLYELNSYTNGEEYSRKDLKILVKNLIEIILYDDTQSYDDIDSLAFNLGYEREDIAKMLEY